MQKEDLLRLIADDDLGLLTIPKASQSTVTEEDRWIASIISISNFYAENAREPQKCKDIAERKLANQLKALRHDEQAKKVITAYDEYELLDGAPESECSSHKEHNLKNTNTNKTEKPTETRKEKAPPPKVPNSFEDIFADDDLGILDSNANDIFTLKHVPSTKEIESPDFVAKRKPCKDFHRYEMLFKACHADLIAKKRNTLPFAKDSKIRKGLFFVLKGMLVYIAKAGKWERKGERKNRRLHCIFENETEAHLLQYSLGRELYRDGKRITELHEKLLDGFNNITDEDEQTGEIYIVRSLSSDPDIQSFPELFKIGFTTRSVKERLANAENEPSYLMAPVALEKAYKCYNMNTQKLENLLHQFFGAACLNVDVFDHDGERHTPREWFCAPLKEIEQAVALLVSGEIVKYRYDVEKKTIVGR